MYRLGSPIRFLVSFVLTRMSVKLHILELRLGVGV